jgi:hypothetical protein
MLIFHLHMLQFLFHGFLLHLGRILENYKIESALKYLIRLPILYALEYIQFPPHLKLRTHFVLCGKLVLEYFKLLISALQILRHPRVLVCNLVEDDLRRSCFEFHLVEYIILVTRQPVYDVLLFARVLQIASQLRLSVEFVVPITIRPHLLRILHVHSLLDF